MKTSIPKSKRPLPKSKQIGLRSKLEGKCAWDRLPFVGKDHGPQSFWDVPLTGGFFGGIDAGRAMAFVHLKHVRNHRGDEIHNASGILTSILMGMDNKQPSSKEEADSLRGQRVGFMNEICSWIKSAAEQLGSTLDAIPERSFVQQANENLERTDADLMSIINSKVNP
ncbi:hypothetical protein HX787_20360 [Pseudomonas tolaasii]|uniref:Uncharacterized protein n=1 Tax=Pseudomonas tolaasii TaxID=29442 RepID=A0A7Y8ARN4_PSETO|nr:hypothetical protein [Pseudomonas tolaasii]NWC24050.1 hypothetical protein [Pseudomonas tolaasii]NWD38221.1 hypothetical protein [Pseudomonas tolaasii]